MDWLEFLRSVSRVPGRRKRRSGRRRAFLRVEAGDEGSDGDGGGVEGGGLGQTQAQNQGQQQQQTPPQQQQGQQEQWSLRSEAARALGEEKPEWQDDKSAWDAIQDRYSRAMAERDDQIRQLRQFQDFYLAQQAEAQKAQQQKAQGEKPPVWQKPDWKDEYAAFFARHPETGAVLRDPQTGMPKLLPGADPSIALKYHRNQEWQRETLQKILDDPAGALWPVFEEKLLPLLEEKVKAALGGYGAQDAARRYLDGRRQEFFAHKDGKPLFDQQGKPVLTDVGVVFQRAVDAAANMGIADPDAQAKYAEDQIELFKLRKAQAKPDAKGQQGQQQNQQQQQQQTLPPNEGGGTATQRRPGLRRMQGAGGANLNVGSGGGRKDFKTMMREAAARAG